LGAGTGAGIRSTGASNRIQDNLCSTANRGIDVGFSGNFIAGNTCSGNTTNWSVAGGNVCLVVQGATGGAIVGNAGGVATGSTDPGANYTY
jgi:parallel beta-helix repeat protein